MYGTAVLIVRNVPVYNSHDGSGLDKQIGGAGAVFVKNLSLRPKTLSEERRTELNRDCQPLG